MTIVYKEGDDNHPAVTFARYGWASGRELAEVIGTITHACSHVPCAGPRARGRDRRCSGGARSKKRSSSARIAVPSSTTSVIAMAPGDYAERLAPFVRHAVLFGDECVVETAREMFTAEANEMRRKMPGPVDLTWLPEVERERLLDERIEARASFCAEVVAMKRALDRLPVEIALAQRRAAKPRARQTRQRRTTAALRAQVLDLHQRGLVLAAIANTLNISDRRVRELLRDTGNPRNGGRKASARQAPI
jgi:hypothetical protein